MANTPIFDKDRMTRYALEQNSTVLAIDHIIDTLRKDSLNKDCADGYEALTPGNIEGLHLAVKMLAKASYNKGIEVIEMTAPSLNQEIISF